MVEFSYPPKQPRWANVVYCDISVGILRNQECMFSLGAPVAYYQLKSPIEHTGPVYTSFEGQNVSFWSLELKP